MALLFGLGLLQVHSAALVLSPLFAFIDRDISQWLGVPLALVIVAMIGLRKWGKRRMGHWKAAESRSSSITPGTSPMTVHRRAR